MLPGGSAARVPKDLLDTESMRSLLERLREEFDVVIVDAPPLPDAGAAALAARADGAVLVFQAGRTPEAKVRRAMARLRAAGVRVLGCVLTMRPAGLLTGYPGKLYRPAANGRRSATGHSHVKPQMTSRRRQNGAAADPAAEDGHARLT